MLERGVGLCAKDVAPQACRRRVVQAARGDSSSWAGRKIWLKVGGVKSRGWFWVNETPAAFVENYCGTCKFEITDLVTPGEEATFAVQVNSEPPCRKGLFNLTHRCGGWRDENDLFMVGEGGADCYAYLARRRKGDGVVYESFGLDLLSGKPEGTTILDGMIDCARNQ